MKRRYEGLQLELAKNRCRMWEIVGKTELLFSDIDGIGGLIDQVRQDEDALSDFEKRIKANFREFDSITCRSSVVPSIGPSQGIVGAFNGESKTLSDKLKICYDKDISDVEGLINKLDESTENLINAIQNCIIDC